MVSKLTAAGADVHTLPQSYHKPGVTSLLDWCQDREWRKVAAALQRSIEAAAAGRYQQQQPAHQQQQQQQQGPRQLERPLPDASDRATALFELIVAVLLPMLCLSFVAWLVYKVVWCVWVGLPLLLNFCCRYWYVVPGMGAALQMLSPHLAPAASQLFQWCKAVPQLQQPGQQQQQQQQQTPSSLLGDLVLRFFIVPLLCCMLLYVVSLLWAAAMVVLHFWPVIVPFCWSHWRILAGLSITVAVAVGVMHVLPVVTAWVARVWHAAVHLPPAAAPQQQQQQQHALQERQPPEGSSDIGATAAAAGPSSSTARSSQLCAICLDAAATVGIAHKKGDVIHCCLCPGCADELKKEGQLKKCVYCQEPVRQLVQVVGT